VAGLHTAAKETFDPAIISAFLILACSRSAAVTACSRSTHIEAVEATVQLKWRTTLSP
jgi:hypothetical protein